MNTESYTIHIGLTSWLYQHRIPIEIIKMHIPIQDISRPKPIEILYTPDSVRLCK